MAHKVIITVKPGGNITSRVEGISGPSCGEKTRWLDNLGIIVKHEDTPEAFEHVSESEGVDEKVNTGSDW